MTRQSDIPYLPPVPAFAFGIATGLTLAILISGLISSTTGPTMREAPKVSAPVSDGGQNSAVPFFVQRHGENGAVSVTTKVSPK